jgi:hypothetical protein
MANKIARFAVNGVVKLRQTSRAQTPAAVRDRNDPRPILARLVFCQALSSPAHRSPPGSSYLPSISFHPRRHQVTPQFWTVSYDRPALHAVDIASRDSTALLVQYDSRQYAFRSSLRFVLKRRLHQDSIEWRTRLPGSLSTEWWAPMRQSYTQSKRKAK